MVPIPDTLPPEIWHGIVEVGDLSDSDLKAMLAVAPQTTAKGMHDAAFSLFFRELSISLNEKTDPLRYAAVQYKYNTTTYFNIQFEFISHSGTEQCPSFPHIRSRNLCH